jgi:flagellar motor switch protein FliG
LFGKVPDAKPQYASSEAIWAELRVRKVPDIVAYLCNQKSAVISIILSQFSSELASEILSELPEQLSVSCVRQMSRGETIEDSTLAAVAELIQTEFLATAETDDAASSVNFVSEILGILPKDRRDKMLDSLDDADPEQAQLIRKRMLTFEDLPKRLPTTAIPIIFKDCDPELLLKALKAGQDQEPATVEFLYANISQRMAGQYKEQVEELGGISQKEADTAIASLMGFIGRLEKDGRVTLIKPVSEDAADA